MESRLRNNIVLIGFMGSGKSTVAHALSSEYGLDIVEMDEMIEAREGMSISDIFKVHGEEYFRNLETNLLIEMQDRTGVVISCGGGVPLREQNVIEMKKNGFIFWLTAKPETIYERVKDCHNRPLLEENMNIEFITDLIAKRTEKYKVCADYIFETDGETPEDLADDIYHTIVE